LGLDPGQRRLEDLADHAPPPVPRRQLVVIDDLVQLDAELAVEPLDQLASLCLHVGGSGIVIIHCVHGSHLPSWNTVVEHLRRAALLFYSPSAKVTCQRNHWMESRGPGPSPALISK